jgi:hypothetical protein
MISISGSRCRLSLAALLGVVLALVASGCMWGVVRDADTGAPLSGARVTYKDSKGQTASTTTDANGFFGFGAPASVPPAMGPVTFAIDAPGYQTFGEVRTVAYDDNPGATLADPNSFMDAQAFSVSRGAGAYHNAEVGFSIVFPADWDVQESSDKLGVMASAPASSKDAPAVCSVTSGPYPEGVDPMAFVDDLLASIKKSSYVSRFRIYKETAVKVNGVPAVRADYSYTLEITGGDFSMELSAEYLTYFLAKGYTGYSIDCFTYIDKFAAMESTFDGVGQSFRLD